MLKNKYTIKFLLFSYFTISYLLLNNFANATINFGSRNSAINIYPYTAVLIGSPDNALTIDGTLSKNAGGQLEGNQIQFDKGIIENNTTQSLLTAVFDPTDPDTIYLTGNSFIYSEPGTILQRIEVQENNNRLEGQALFAEPISFQDSNTTLTIALQNTLNQNINLNGGTLQLADQLKLADEVKIGSGTIILNNFQLTLGSFYSSPWTSTIIWDNALDIALNGRTDLTGEWVFVGINNLNGNGNVLDLTLGGTIRVAPNSTLYLTDVHLRGIGEGKFGKIILDNNDSEAKLYNVDIELVNDFTTTIGGIYVEGPTTFILKENDWTFSYNSTLTVDGVSLWLDCLDRPRDEWPHPGQLQAPLPLFIDTTLMDKYLKMDLKLNLDLINRGTIREVVDFANIISQAMPCSTLTGGLLNTDVLLKHSCHIHPVKHIEVAGNITINGQGATLVFSNPSQPQFIVNEGCSVTLKNIELDRINNHTFNLKWRSFRDPITHKWTIEEGQINIGENVVFGLEEDVALPNGLINLLAKSNGDPIIFSVRGVDGKHSLVLNPSEDYKKALINATRDKTVSARLDSYQNPVLIRLNENTLSLHSTNLWGIDYISNTISKLGFSGAIALTGNASTNFGNPQNKNSTYSMAFVIENSGNKFNLLKDSILFSGQLLFADEGENSLEINAVLTERIIEPSDDSSRTIPLVNFGSDFLRLSSTNGQAKLIFGDPQIRVNNSPNGFIAEENSILNGNKVEIYGDHIWDLYDLEKGGIPFVSNVKELLAPDPNLNNIPIVSSLSFSLRYQPLFQKEPLAPKMQTAFSLKHQKNNTKVIQSNDTQENILRTIQPPDPSEKIVTFFDIRNQELTQAKGNIILDEASATKFSIDLDNRINISLKNGSRITLRPDENVELKINDIINVIGNNNEIYISKTLCINGKLLFNQNSSLKIIFLEPDAKIIFAKNTLLNLEQGTNLIIQGDGTFELGNNSIINLKGAISPESRPEIILQDNACMSPANQSTIQIKGLGYLTIKDGASVKVQALENIIFGNSNTDEIEVSVIGGIIQLQGNTSGYGRISFQKGTFNLSASIGGIISIEDKGWLEINSVNRTLAPGNFQAMRLDPHGQFSLKNGGKLSFASNLNEFDGKKYIIWESVNTFISGAVGSSSLGIIEYINPTLGFEGRLQANRIHFDSGSTGLSAEQLTRTNVNQLEPLSRFPTATLVTNSNNENWLRLKNGIKIKVIDGDTFIEEDTDPAENGAVIGIDKYSNQVIYNLNGRRTVRS